MHVFYLQVDIPSEPEDDEEDPDGRFGFKRKLGVKYLAVSWFSAIFTVSLPHIITVVQDSLDTHAVMPQLFVLATTFVGISRVGISR